MIRHLLNLHPMPGMILARRFHHLWHKDATLRQLEQDASQDIRTDLLVCQGCLMDPNQPRRSIQNHRPSSLNLHHQPVHHRPASIVMAPKTLRELHS
jgi:hypothetical protein